MVKVVDVRLEEKKQYNLDVANEDFKKLYTHLELFIPDSVYLPNRDKINNSDLTNLNKELKNMARSTIAYISPFVDEPPREFYEHFIQNVGSELVILLRKYSGEFKPILDQVVGMGYSDEELLKEELMEEFGVLHKLHDLNVKEKNLGKAGVDLNPKLHDIITDTMFNTGYMKGFDMDLEKSLDYYKAVIPNISRVIAEHLGEVDFKDPYLSHIFEQFLENRFDFYQRSLVEKFPLKRNLPIIVTIDKYVSGFSKNLESRFDEVLKNINQGLQEEIEEHF